MLSLNSFHGAAPVPETPGLSQDRYTSLALLQAALPLSRRGDTLFGQAMG